MLFAFMTSCSSGNGEWGATITGKDIYKTIYELAEQHVRDTMNEDVCYFPKATYSEHIFGNSHGFEIE